jgi:hypothetical protein
MQVVIRVEVQKPRLYPPRTPQVLVVAKGHLKLKILLYTDLRVAEEDLFWHRDLGLLTKAPGAAKAAAIAAGPEPIIMVLGVLIFSSSSKILGYPERVLTRPQYLLPGRWRAGDELGVLCYLQTQSLFSCPRWPLVFICSPAGLRIL